VISFADGGALGNVLLFAASGGATEPVRIWRTDGTAAGTMPVVPVSPAGGGAVGGRFVLAGIEDSGAALWSTDGTPAGATRLQTIRPGPWQVTATDVALFLTSPTTRRGQSCGAATGTPEGTFRVRDLTPGPSDTEFGLRTPFAGGLAFVVQRAAGDEVWFSDGSDAGTRMVTALQGDHNRVRNLLDVDGVLYLDVGGLEPGSELWRSDGTTSGTTRVVDLSAGAEPVTSVWLAAGPGSLFFAAADASTGLELWHSDGTAAGTGPRATCFRATTVGSSIPTARWCSARRAPATRCSSSPTTACTDRRSGAATAARPAPRCCATSIRAIRALLEDFALPLVPVGERVVFAPRDADAGVEPWISDGTDAGTRRLADIAPGDAVPGCAGRDLRGHRGRTCSWKRTTACTGASCGRSAEPRSTAARSAPATATATPASASRSSCAASASPSARPPSTSARPSTATAAAWCRSPSSSPPSVPR
jgi:ELWxxDGT repeat protein